MKPSHLDRISTFFAQQQLTRREALARGGASLAAAAAAESPAASAQEATPEPATAADSGSNASSMLFLQTFQSGTIAPVEGVEGRYTVTLEAGTGQTVYFSDRPERIVGADPTPDFLQGIGFFPDNPPNAALVVETAPGETDIAVVELFNPLYDPVSQGVTYEVEVLANWQDELELGFSEAPTDLAALAPSFGAAQLFIDDCDNSDIWCDDQLGNDYGTISANAEMCWNYSLCQPCEPYGHTYPSYCAGYTYWKDKCDQAYGNCGTQEGGCIARWHWLGPAFC